MLVLLTLGILAFMVSQAFADVGPVKEPTPPPAPAPVVVQPAPTTSTQVYSSVSSVTIEQQEKEYNMGDKFVRGLANMLTSPLELPRCVQNVTEEQGVLVGWTGGVAQGIGMTAMRIIVGAVEVVTFPVPGPDGYKPWVEPEFVWQAPGPKITPQSASAAKK